MSPMTEHDKVRERGAWPGYYVGKKVRMLLDISTPTAPVWLQGKLLGIEANEFRKAYHLEQASGYDPVAGEAVDFEPPLRRHINIDHVLIIEEITENEE
jgi:hypothetical protein